MEQKVLDGISYVKSSKNRYKVINSMSSKFKMPSEISKETSIRLNHVSALLTELKNEGLVECLNEEKKKGRIYCLTDFGKDVLEIIEEQE